MAALVLVVDMVVAVAFGVVGVLALATGRVVVPWLRRTVRRPALWGAGALLVSGALAGAHVMPYQVDVPLMLGGLALIGAAQILGSREPRRAG
ncbi:hypothetical protein NMG29_03140 [Streptomyces cocklensis]|uniref:Uncharacterized protein n=1 Tax=Actinacidiphila cocklensis TaxID=887465 RepID=A0A9W4GRR5_9ACTN|nr:hypothetical protein [Actinacidiphila cocklensis]MDD1057229.1 hypothetical protein [Actinacidiphila cocklensis]WSX78390.1 hypothetical protein OH826_33825 [Streptomyces sp. NBC_00899]CAG6395017.1 conserved membrane hypothetical protein [Actinacidiphila cocklensis]